MMPAPEVPKLSPEAVRVLRVVSVEAADGYTLMSRTGLDATGLSTALQELVKGGLVRVRGDTSTPKVGETYVFVPPDTRGNADFLIRYTTL